ncbi:MAG: hypothetical protein Q8P31_10025 [Bacillota bacterium]|nr:hypothetical protein [Bacillota bacterium]
MADKKRVEREEIDSLDLFQFLGELMGNIEPRSPFLLATVSSEYRGGLPSVHLDGQPGETAAACTYLSSYQPKAGDRVLITRAGPGYVILGKVTSG